MVSLDGSVLPIEADTMCIHSDTPGADRLAAEVRSALEAAGVTVKAFGHADGSDAIVARRTGPFDWWHEADRPARRAFFAASLGWMLDSFDVMLYAMVLASLIEDPTLQLSLSTAGILGSVTLLSAAAGGIVFGILADRFGRKRALMGAVLMYSIFTAACGFAQSAVQLAVFRVLVGLGMGGEWATGAALVSESFPAAHRGKALAFVQSSWAIGYARCRAREPARAAALGLARRVLRRRPARALHDVDSERGRRAAGMALDRAGRSRAPERHLRTRRGAPDLVLTLMNACTLFGWWGLNGWVPAYLRLSPAEGGIGLDSSTMSLFVIAMQVGMWFGYVSFGFIADSIGRKRAYVIFVLLASVLLPVYGQVTGARAAARARTAGRVFRNRLFQWLRRADRRALSDVGSRHGAGLHVQRRPACQRRGAVRGGFSGGDARLRRRLSRDRRRVSRGGDCLDVDSRHRPPRARHDQRLRLRQLDLVRLVGQLLTELLVAAAAGAGHGRHGLRRPPRASFAVAAASRSIAPFMPPFAIVAAASIFLCVKIGVDVRAGSLL